MEYPWTTSIGVPHAVAVVSAAPGSGATLLTAAAGLLIDYAVGRVGQSVILMDTDTDPQTESGGLTELTRFWKTVSDAEVDGLLGFAGDRIGLAERSVLPYMRHVYTGSRRQDMALFALGPEDELHGLPSDETLLPVVGAALTRLAELQGCLIVDCGAGRTSLTLEVCRRLEHIIVIGGPGPQGGDDTAGLLSWLTEHGLGGKVLGWACNDPSGTHPGPACSAEAGPALMRLPYDRSAADAVAQGRLPERTTSPLLQALCEQLLALWPDVLNDGSWGRDE
ncbi:hypothetical protein G9272_07220 [Streptomyces asoensis]|uniref:CobQ/CobB/MinD/ParA nucleotide binding domain-containing protein n=1 Tax=Streptomyces asoensis TaxID=249586 RepID=A0A6M4WJ59_9ACTN|nr:hypothetical protein [Streptomyces asoensis]QJT00098.1 hypothetical protein G9272_07220 [Streptomyces asoensis]